MQLTNHKYIFFTLKFFKNYQFFYNLFFNNFLLPYSCFFTIKFFNINLYNLIFIKTNKFFFKKQLFIKKKSKQKVFNNIIIKPQFFNNTCIAIINFLFKIDTYWIYLYFNTYYLQFFKNWIIFFTYLSFIPKINKKNKIFNYLNIGLKSKFNYNLKFL